MRPLLQPTFLLLVAAQGAFGLAWSVFMLVPKYMSESLGADPAAIGRVSSLANVAAIASIPFVGWALDRFGRHATFALGSALIVLQACAFAVIEDVGPLLYGAQMLWGIAFVMAFNAGNAMVVDVVPPAHLGHALGVFGVANIVMNAVASVVVEGVVGTLGWPTTLAGASLFGALALVLSRWMPRSSGASLPGETSHERVVSRDLLFLWLSSLTWGVAYATVMVFFQPFLLQQGVPHVSRFFIGFAGGAVFVRLALGQWVDRFGGRRIAAASLLLYGLATLSLPAMSGATMSLFGAWVGVAHGFLHPALSAVAVAGRPARIRGTLLAYTTGSFMLGSALGSGVLGSVAEQAGFERVFFLGGIIALAGVLPLLPGAFRALDGPR